MHSARKELKKARAVLRLLRAVLGRRAFASENAVLRDAARPLGKVRDSKVLLERLEELIGRPKAGPIDEFTSTLQGAKTQARRVWLAAAGLRSRHRALRELAARSTRWHVGRHGWSVLGAGIGQTYARGRRAFAAAREKPSVEHLHEWRKQAKYLCYQLQFLRPVAPKPLGRLTREVYQLSKCLGLDHDLALLREKVHKANRQAHREHRALLALIDARRARQQALAFARGEKLYRVRPAAFTQLLGTYWRAWKRAARANESPATAALEAASRKVRMAPSRRIAESTRT